MKKILIPIEIKTENDLPKEDGTYFIDLNTDKPGMIGKDVSWFRTKYDNEVWKENVKYWLKEVTIDELLPSEKEIKKFVEYTLIPEGYKTIHIGSPLEVANIQFLERKRIDKFVNELTYYIKQKLES